MLFNYFKITLRYLLKNRTFSFINIFGLTFGFLCFTLIALYLFDELSFDMLHKDAGRTYRVIQHIQQDDGTLRTVAPVAARIAPAALSQLPEVEDVLRVSGIGRITLGNDPVTRDYERVLTIDENFFTFFDFQLLEGDPATALKQPDGIVLSEKLAKKYFGNEPAMGKSLWSALRRNEQNVHLTVTGIMKDFPKNSHLQIDIIYAESTWPTVFQWYTNFMSSDWSSNNFITYVKLKPGADQQAFEQKLTELVKANYPADKDFKSTFTLQPMKDIHLYSDSIQGATNEVNANSIKPFYLYLFAAVAFLILLIASLNYMNLSTAAAIKRTREIGTRKTLGALRAQLVAQFSGEAILLSAASLFLAGALLQILLPFVNSFTEKELSLQALPVSWAAVLILVMIASGLLSSLYPAFIIARVKPAEALKKDVKLGNRSLPVRKVLVAGQFAISIIMIASTLVIYRQLNFMRSKELGFNLQNLLVIDINSGRLRQNFESVKAEFASVPEVQSITTSTRVPGEWKSFPITTVKAEGEPRGSEMIYVGIDQDFLSTYNIQLLEGRNFVAGPADSTKVILTKLAVEQLGLTNPVGQVIEIPSVRWGASIEPLEKSLKVEVIGIADDFHFESFRQQMKPVIFAAPNTSIQRIDYYTVSIQTSNWSETLEKLKAANTKIDPDNPLEYTFLDSRFEEFYKADEKRGQIFLVFSSVIVLIACLGLFAVVSYTIESRTKEIGIRKVLGASVRNIVGLVSKEFLLLVLMAGVVAIPVSYFMMKNWLQDFAYHVGMGADVFVLAGMIALIIAFATISFRSIKAAVANPVESLRNE
ncbi:MAG TPA: ABC transporter permease [Cyclobacteriaceae bacterium]|nr:ABC transporter permease [Cyclobacteriaceae bacterium]HRJ80650.1 ABC transporter permease [Cyclobacteriaceae bacterium]